MLAVGRRLCSSLKELLNFRSYYTNMQIASQQQTALDERCILVDEFDKPIGEATKKHCHQIAKDGCIPLHRAFSVFLFNNNGDLLIQKRSATKVSLIFLYCITF
jgi:isopentenyl-diphosphate delta-isomerase